MGPLLTSVISSVGADLLNRTGLSNFLPLNRTSSTQAEPFDSHLNKAQQTKAPETLLDVLKSNHVKDVHNLKSLINHTNEQLLSHHELRSALGQVRSSEALYLTKNENNTFSIKTLDGNIATFGADTQVGKLAEQLHQMQSTLVSKDRDPHHSLYEVAENISRQPNNRATWELREESTVVRRS